MSNRGFAPLTIAILLFGLACTSPSNQSPATNAPAAAAPTASVDEFAGAKANYAKMCADCHNSAGEGGTVQLDDRQLKVPSLREGHALNHSDQQLVKQVLDGGEGMPAFKDKLSTGDAAGLVRFIRKEFQAK